MSRSCCREVVENYNNPACSTKTSRDVRTMKLNNVDLVQNFLTEEEPSNSTTRGFVRLKWDPPENPNGAVVSYTTEYRTQIQDAVVEKKCILETDYRNLTNGCELIRLNPGNYSIRVRANTLAGPGLFSEYRYIIITQPIMPTWEKITIGCSVFLGLIFFGVCMYGLKKKLVPLSEIMIPTVNPSYYIHEPVFQTIETSWNHEN